MTRTRTVLLAFVLLSAIAAGGVGAGFLPQGAIVAGENESVTGLAFDDVASDVGFEYRIDADRSGMLSHAGVYAVDYDNNGWTDLLAVGGDRPVLFANENGTFRRDNQLADVKRPMRAAVFFDYNVDGWDDLLLLPSVGEPVVMRNDRGTLRRADVGLSVDLIEPVGATTGDVNGDGCPDLFVIQNGDFSERLPRGMGNPDNDLRRDNGNSNRLFEGSCGSFDEVTERAGIRGTRWSLATSMADLNGDGRVDIHVANDFNHDVVYWNRGDGTFRQEKLADETNRNGMSSEITDVNGDEDLDVFVTNIHFPRDFAETLYIGVGNTRAQGNNLLVNRGNRTFVDRADEYGVRKGGWGWAAIATDFDNDGDVDMFHTTSSFSVSTITERMDSKEVKRTRDQYPMYTYPAVFERRDDGSSPYVITNPAQLGFNETNGRGAAQLDFDRDGDVDVAVAVAAGNDGAAYRLYENRGATERALQVRLVGNTTLGARVTTTIGNRTQLKAYNARADYLSQDSRVLHFGAGNRSRADLRIVWPDGNEQTIPDVPTNRRLVVSRRGTERTFLLNADDPTGETWHRAARTSLAIVPPIVGGLVLVAYWYHRVRS